ncbi:hypothetical protein [Algoriphagus zhangzhouensis]|nr:hypothetical protein [Algoriphagus zhangzhouensis]
MIQFSAIIYLLFYAWVMPFPGKPKYIITIEKSNPKYFRIKQKSNKDLSDKMINISESCFNGAGKELMLVKKRSEDLPEEEKKQFREFGLVGIFYLDDHGKIGQMEFWTSKDPTQILPLIAKVEKHYKSEFQIENSDCKIEEGKFVRTHMAIAINERDRNR